MVWWKPPMPTRNFSVQNGCVKHCYRYFCTCAGGAFYGQRSPAHYFNSLGRVFDPNTFLAFFIQQRGIEAAAVILYSDDMMFICFPCRNNDLALTRIAVPDAVQNGIFYHRLNGIGRHIKISVTDMIFSAQLVLKSFSLL